MADTEFFLESLQSAEGASHLLFLDVLTRLSCHVKIFGLLG